MAKIEKLDTTTEAMLKRCRDAAEITGGNFHASEAMRFASGVFALEAMNEKDPVKVTDFLLVWMATPGWFACGNNSQCRQAAEKKGISEDTSVKDAIMKLLKK